MKALKSIFAVLLSAALVFSFASCSDDDDDDGLSTVATFATEAEKGEYEQVVFYDNNSFDYQTVSSDVTFTMLKGTYTGDPTKASEKITLTFTKVLKAFADENSNSMDFIDITDEILETLHLEKTMEVTISDDGKTVEVFGDTYTKK